MSARRWSMVLVVLAVIAFGTSVPALAQTDEDHFQTFPFNFSNPGARSSAMGGAFIGLADDASAAVANPAGLTTLGRKQIYVEYKNIDAPVVAFPRFDSLSGGFADLTGEKRNIPSFINYAQPLANGKYFVALSEHMFLSYRNGFTSVPPGNQLNFVSRRTVGVSSAVFPATQTTIEMTGVSLSGAFGAKVNEKVSIGGSLSMSRLGVDVDARRSQDRSAATGCPTCAIIPSTAIHDHPWAPGATLGLLFQAAEPLSIGLVYSFEPRFKATETVTEGFYPSNPNDKSWEIPLKTPARFGAGVGYRPHGRILAGFDVVYVQYSQLAKFETPNQLVLFRDLAGSFPTLKGSPAVTDAVTNGTLDITRFNIDSGVDVHGGIEVKVREGNNPIFVRYGAAVTQPHTLTFPGNCGDFHSKDFGSCSIASQLYFASQSQDVTGVPVAIAVSNTDAFLLAQKEVGISVGGGIVVGTRTKPVQIDAAFVHTNYKRQEFILSTAIRF